jgi:cell division protein FtsI (penicillin-binding protein 3)
MEQTLDDQLRGRAGLARVLTDVKHRGIASRVSTEAVSGENVTLTIDERIQFVAERELKRAAKTHECPTGSLVVMNPHTGEILALASYPSFDSNVPARSEEDLDKRENHAISVPFEPGSVFKVITAAAALETTRLRPESMIACGSGRINLFGRVIHDHKAYSEMTLAEVLAYSSNIGAIQIAMEVGEAHLLDYIRRFGFGKETGIPLPGESAGQVWDLKDWGKTSIGSVAMGHEISTTTLQLAQAASVIANGGSLVTPRLVLRRQRPGEPPEESAVETRRRVIRPETAIALRQMMEGVVLDGTGKLARLDGYTAGGKTGSAQIFDPEIGRYTHRYNASFLGLAPVANPAIVVVVTLNGASKFGGAVAAPVFREVAMAALRLLDVPKDLPETPPLREDEPVDFSDLAIADLGPSARLLPGPRVPARRDILEVWGPRVPDFYGKTMRTVLEQSSARGLPVELSGSGIARAQAPAAGAILRRGERVRIQFAR